MSKFTILLLEDDADLRLVYSELLAGENVRLLEAANGECALDILKREKVGLVIADVHMPHMGGLEFLRNLRGQGDETLVIFASGVLDRHVFNEGAKLGVFEYVDKIDLNGFLSVVESARKYWESRTATPPGQ